MAYIDVDKIPYYLDTSENAPMEGRRVAFKSDIDKIPTADVAEVVRCKDCNFVYFNSDSETYHCKRRGYYSEAVKPTDFCSYGERKGAE